MKAGVCFVSAHDRHRKATAIKRTLVRLTLHAMPMILYNELCEMFNLQECMYMLFDEQ